MTISIARASHDSAEAAVHLKRAQDEASDSCVPVYDSINGRQPFAAQKVGRVVNLLTSPKSCRALLDLTYLRWFW